VDKKREYWESFSSEILAYNSNTQTLYCLLNIKETSGKLAFPGEITFAKMGSDSVYIKINFYEKSSFTAISSIIADKSYYLLPISIVPAGKLELSKMG
jgi:hypothetical protein